MAVLGLAIGNRHPALFIPAVKITHAKVEYMNQQVHHHTQTCNQEAVFF